MLTNQLHNEPALLEQLQSGNEEAFTTLYRHYSPQLYLNILKMVRDPQLAEEMVQELFTRIWQKRSCPALLENFAGYMYRIALNLVHDFFRKLKRDRNLMACFTQLHAEEYSHIEESVGSKESSVTLQKVIDLLPPQQKKVYHLVKEEGYTYKKAAEVLNISPYTVKEYLSSSTKTIRQHLLRHANSIILILLVLLYRP